MYPKSVKLSDRSLTQKAINFMIPIILQFFRRQNHRETSNRPVVTKGYGWVQRLILQGHGEIIWQDRTILYLVCGGGDMTMFVKMCRTIL